MPILSLAVFCSVLLFAAPVIAQDAADKPENTEPADPTVQLCEEGFESLFNGHDLTGWVQMEDAKFTVRDGKLICTGQGNYPTWLRTEDEYENFILRLKYKTFYGAEGGVFFHAPIHGRLAHVGYDIRIGDNTGEPKDYSPGAIFEAVPPTVCAQRHFKDQEWNDLEIAMQWPRLTVTLNGQKVQDLNIEENEELKYKLRHGYIGLQDRGKTIHFRDIRIKRLENTISDQWQTLYKMKGENLEGWTVSEGCSAKWYVDDEGALVAEDGHGYLISDEKFRNLELKFYFKMSKNCNGGIFLRWVTGKGRGFEVQLEDIPDSKDPTGSIYQRVRAHLQPHVYGEWALMQIFLNENHCLVRVNGTTVAESDSMGGAREGNISIQMHRGGAWLRYKDIQARRLPDPVAEN